MESKSLQPRFDGRFDALLSLADGWLDGKGIAPDKERLIEVMEKVVGQYPEEIPLPVIVPTPEGNLLFEWNVPGDPSVDLHLDSMRAAFHAFRRDGGEIEREFLLTSNEAWGRFFNFLKDTLERCPA